MIFKTSVSFIVIFILTSVIINAQFRNSTWGDTREEVMIVEGRVDTGPNWLVYESQAGGKKAFILFIFIDDSLELGSYIFSENHNNNIQYLYDFHEINELIAKRHGEPRRKIEIITHNSDIASRSDLNELQKLELGAISFRSVWFIENTTITHHLRREDDDKPKLLHTVSYQSDTYREKSEQQRVRDF